MIQIREIIAGELGQKYKNLSVCGPISYKKQRKVPEELL